LLAKLAGQQVTGAVAKPSIAWKTARMAGVKRPAGPSSSRTAANVARLRRQQGKTAADLSRGLTRAEQPILDTGITKIEKGDRRVDVDDLVALAVALDVSPNVLLLPPVQAPMADVNATADVTPGVKASVGDMWAWATGERPLHQAPPRAEAAFVQENRPTKFVASFPNEAVAGHWGALSGLGEVIRQAIRDGVPTATIRSFVEMTLVAALNSLGGADGDR